jgi:hypothetical protein
MAMMKNFAYTRLWQKMQEKLMEEDLDCFVIASVDKQVANRVTNGIVRQCQRPVPDSICSQMRLEKATESARLDLFVPEGSNCAFFKCVHCAVMFKSISKY